MPLPTSPVPRCASVAAERIRPGTRGFARLCRRHEPAQHAGKQGEDEADENPRIAHTRVRLRLSKSAALGPPGDVDVTVGKRSARRFLIGSQRCQGWIGPGDLIPRAASVDVATKLIRTL